MLHCLVDRAIISLKNTQCWDLGIFDRSFPGLRRAVVRNVFPGNDTLGLTWSTAADWLKGKIHWNPRSQRLLSENQRKKNYVQSSCASRLEKTQKKVIENHDPTDL